MTLFIAHLLASATTLPTTQPAAADAGHPLTQALQISGISLIAIFSVMAVFAAAIVLVGKLFPDQQE